MLDVLAGQQPPTEGTVTAAGRDVTRLGAEERCRRGIGRSHQVPRPFGAHLASVERPDAVTRIILDHLEAP